MNRERGRRPPPPPEVAGIAACPEDSCYYETNVHNWITGDARASPRGSAFRPNKLQADRVSPPRRIAYSVPSALAEL